MYYQDSEKTLESLLQEQSRLNNQLVSLRQSKNTSNLKHQQSSYEFSKYNMKNNNKKVMADALKKTIMITLISTIGLTFLGSIFITSLIPLILGSALVGACIGIPFSLIEAARKMTSYDRQQIPRQENYDNSNYMQISNEINRILQRLKEIDREIRVRSEANNQTYSSTSVNTYPRVQVYQSNAYNGNLRLYQPQQVIISRAERHR